MIVIVKRVRTDLAPSELTVTLSTVANMSSSERSSPMHRTKSGAGSESVLASDNSTSSLHIIPVNQGFEKRCPVMNVMHRSTLYKIDFATSIFHRPLLSKFVHAHVSIFHVISPSQDCFRHQELIKFLNSCRMVHRYSTSREPWGFWGAFLGSKMHFRLIHCNWWAWHKDIDSA